MNYKKEAFKNNLSTLTPVSSEDEGGKSEVLNKVESQPKTVVQSGASNSAKMYPIKNNILLNVLKLGNKQQEQTNSNYYHQQNHCLLNQKQKSYDSSLSGDPQKMERNPNAHYQQGFKQNQGRRDKNNQNMQHMNPILEESNLGKRSYTQGIEQTARKSAIESFLGLRKTIKKQKKPFPYRTNMKRERPQTNTPFPIEDYGNSNEITNMKEFYNKGHQIGSQLKSNYYDLSREDSHTWKMNRQGSAMNRQMNYMNPLGKMKKGEITKLYKKL